MGSKASAGPTFPNMRILVPVGGVTDSGQIGLPTSPDTLLSDTWHYDGSVWTEATPATPLLATAYHQAVYTGNAILLFSDTEVWKYE